MGNTAIEVYYAQQSEVANQWSENSIAGSPVDFPHSGMSISVEGCIFVADRAVLLDDGHIYKRKNIVQAHIPYYYSIKGILCPSATTDPYPPSKHSYSYNTENTEVNFTLPTVDWIHFHSNERMNLRIAFSCNWGFYCILWDKGLNQVGLVFRVRKYALKNQFVRSLI